MCICLYLALIVVLLSLILVEFSSFVSLLLHKPSHSERFTFDEMRNSNKTICGVNILKIWPSEELIREHLPKLFELYARGLIKPVVDRIFEYSEIGAAHRHLHSRKSIGKVILRPDSEQ